MTDQFLDPPTGSREAARLRGEQFRRSEREYRDRAVAEVLPRLKAKYEQAADSYARLAELEEAVVRSGPRATLAQPLHR